MCGERRSPVAYLVLIFTQVEGLNSEIEGLNAAVAKAREAHQQAQAQKFQVSAHFS